MRIEFIIKDIRKSKRISLKQLSLRSSISATHINDIENNLKSPSIIILISIAKALHVEVTDLYIVYH